MLKLKSVYTSSLNLGCLLVLLPALAEARSCYYYVDAFGRTRERCQGLLGGGIAGIVVGAVILMILVSTLTHVIRRRRQRASTLPVVNQLYYDPAHVMGQPTDYPPPTFPPPTQPPYQTGYQGAPTNQYQPPPGPPPGQNIQIPMPAANHA